MPGHDETTVGRLLDAFIAGDQAALDGLFSDDAVWHEPGNAPISGDHKGKEQIFQFFGQVGERSGGTFKPEFHDALGNDEHEVLIYRGTANHNGKQLDSPESLIAHVRDGKITEVWNSVASTAELRKWEEFWA